MSPSHTKTGVRYVSAPGEVDSLQSSWSRDWYKYLPVETSSTVQREKQQFVSYREVKEKIADAMFSSAHRASGQSDLVEPLKLQAWSKYYNTTIQNSEMKYSTMKFLIVDAMTELAHVLNYRTNSPSSTGLASDKEMPTDMLRELFRNANDEVFEDGMTSRFSDALHRIVQEHGVEAVKQLGVAIRAADTPIRVAEETLRQVGYMNDRKTHSIRRSLLERSLESPNMRIRDAASIGIEAMEDPAAIPALKRAIENEPIGWLRQYLEDVTNQLKTRHEVPEES